MVEVASQIDFNRLGNDPESYLQELEDNGLLDKTFPAVARSKGVSQSKIRHAEGGVFNHVQKALQTMKGNTLSDDMLGPVTDPHERMLIALAIMYHDTGKRERNQHDRRVLNLDHVPISMQHARDDLAQYLGEKDLEIVVKMIEWHERISKREGIPTSIFKLRDIFTYEGSLDYGRLFIKFAECDMWGRTIAPDAPNHDEIIEENRKITRRNCALFQILLQNRTVIEANLDTVHSRIRKSISRQIRTVLEG